MFKTRMHKWIRRAMICSLVIISLLITSVQAAVPSGTLQFGDKSNAVKDLQQVLCDAGYLDAKQVTGYFGQLTEDAVKKYQKSNGMPVTGVAGSLTLASLFSADTLLDTSAVYNLGSSGKEVTSLQQALVSLGYLKQSNVTGYYGTLTRSAVQAFQTANYITVTGVAATLTLTKINALTGASNQLDTSATYKLYDEGPGVKLLQEKLSDLGYLASKYATGYYGSITQTAVKSFQTVNGITSTGTASSQTLTLLDSSNAKKASAAAKPSTASASTVSTSIAKPGTLRLGDTGSSVSTLQSNLKKLGFFTGTVTGVFGDATKTAVKAFQKSYGLTADGIVGSVTAAKITSALTSKSTSSSASSAATSSAYSSPNMDTINDALASFSDDQLAEVKLIAQLIKKEAGGQVYKCQVAIGSVVMNRVKATGSDVRSVIYAHSGSSYQFSPAKSGLDGVTYSNTNYYAAIEAYLGATPVGKCYYFCTAGSSSWASRNKSFYATLGSESFYLP